MIRILSLLLSLALSNVTGAFSVTLTAKAGIHFKQEISKEDFFPGVKNVKFTASLDELPDLPPWLKLEQKDPNAPATLYGTPSHGDISTVKIEIIAWNKDTYETERKVVLLTVVNLDATNVKHQVTFQVKNKNLADLLQKNSFLSAVAKVWPKADFVTAVEKSTHRKGGVYPAPGQKEGVYVTVGAKTPVPNDVKILKDICTGVPSENEVAKVFRDAGFDINWCSLEETEISLGSVKPAKGFNDDDKFEPASLDTWEYKTKPEDLTHDLVYIFIPFVIGISFLVILTCVMCFTHERQKKFFLTNGQQKYASKKSMDSQNTDLDGFTYGQLHEEKTDSRSGTPNHLANMKFDEEIGSYPPPYKAPPKITYQQTQDSKF